MLMFSGAEHKYIIQVQKHKVINVFPYSTFHQTLEGRWGITQSQWQYSVLK